MLYSFRTVRRPLCGIRQDHADKVAMGQSFLQIEFPHQRSSSSSRHYSPGWVLVSSTILLHWSLFLAFSIHPLIPILLTFAITSSGHLVLGLPILLVAYCFPFSSLWAWQFHPSSPHGLATVCPKTLVGNNFPHTCLRNSRCFLLCFCLWANRVVLHITALSYMM